MGIQYPDLDSYPQKILIQGSLWAILVVSLILAIFEFIWTSRLEFCDDLLVGKGALVSKLAIGGGSIACVVIVIILIFVIIYLIFPLFKNWTLYHKIELLKYAAIITIIIGIVTFIIGIVISIFGLNHKENSLCVKYLKEGLNANYLCTVSSGYPDYSKEYNKIIAKFAEDPGYYCEKVGMPVLILSIIGIIFIIILAIGYFMGKKHPIEESSIAEGEVEEGNVVENQNNSQVEV